MAASSRGGSCVQKFIAFWVVLLCVLLVLFNVLLNPAPAVQEYRLDVVPPQAKPPAERAAAPPAQPQPGAGPAAGPPHGAGQQRQLHGLVLVQEELKDNNAPRPPPREGEFDEVSKAPDVLPGEDADHLHGRLGLLPDGSERIPPTPLPPGGLSFQDRRDAHRGFCFNSRKSDSLSLNRDQPDVRSKACKAKHETYPTDLPVASVVIIFHNENLSTLLRSVHSILNHSPPRLLREIILVDDASIPDADRFYERHWRRLQGELSEYIQHLPKVRLVRLKERRGLMLARMEGIWRSNAEVTVFLDSHIEATAGWLEPLLARIKEDPKHVVVPSIDSIGNEDFTYRAGGGLAVLGFSWTLGQMPMHSSNGPDGTQPSKSPVMAGGLLASDTRMFLKLGGYDPEMRLYGGEEMEIGFRTWMCGGDIEYVPCSHVGHIFRTPDFWVGQVYKVPGEEITRNKLRTAEVWMDDYKQLVQIAASPLPSNLPMGDLEPRHRLRAKLQCKDFNWYLQNVATDMYAPKLTAGSRAGALHNKGFPGCVDTMGATNQGSTMGLYPCHGQHGTQALLYDGDGMVRLPQASYVSCLALDYGKPTIERCGNQPNMLWDWDPSTLAFKSRAQDACLEASATAAPNSPYSLLVAPCRSGDKAQQWTWD